MGLIPTELPHINLFIYSRSGEEARQCRGSPAEDGQRFVYYPPCGEEQVEDKTVIDCVGEVGHREKFTGKCMNISTATLDTGPVG